MLLLCVQVHCHIIHEQFEGEEDEVRALNHAFRSDFICSGHQHHGDPFLKSKVVLVRWPGGRVRRAWSTVW